MSTLFRVTSACAHVRFLPAVFRLHLWFARFPRSCVCGALRQFKVTISKQLQLIQYSALNNTSWAQSQYIRFASKNTMKTTLYLRPGFVT